MNDTLRSQQPSNNGGSTLGKIDLSAIAASTPLLVNTPGTSILLPTINHTAPVPSPLPTLPPNQEGTNFNSLGPMTSQLTYRESEILPEALPDMGRKFDSIEKMNEQELRQAHQKSTNGVYIREKINNVPLPAKDSKKLNLQAREEQALDIRQRFEEEEERLRQLDANASQAQPLCCLVS